MYSFDKKILVILVLLGSLVVINSMQASAVLDQRRRYSFYHNALGALTVVVEYNQPAKGIVRIAIKNDKGGECGQVCFRAVTEASTDQIAKFKKVIAVKDLARYAYVSDLKIEQGYWKHKLCPPLFFVLEEELKKQRYTGMCLIADPHDMRSGASYDENRKELVEMYSSLGIEPQLRGNSKKPLTIASLHSENQRAIVCVKQKFSSRSLHPLVSVTPSASCVANRNFSSNVYHRLRNFVVAYRKPLVLAACSGLIYAGIKYGRRSSALERRVAVAR